MHWLPTDGGYERGCMETSRLKEAIEYFDECISSQENYGEKEFDKLALAALKFIQYRSQFWSKDSKERAKFNEEIDNG